MRQLAVLRPEPGNAATAARIASAGHDALRLPFFAVAPLDWTPPDPAAHDALILTSANTLRHGGTALSTLRALPVLAVGQATAAAARTAGYQVLLTGTADAAQLLALAETHGITRALHLGGRERSIPESDIVAAAIAVYASEPLPITAGQIAALDDTVALLHSVRAARRLSELMPCRAHLRIAALSPAVRDAAGTGWAAAVTAATPQDAALIAAAITLAD
ncbi:uroporphyrinogen-III synthase [Sphingomonas hylomeconis]|uniref:uroporphyrinogen-III synthase n=1 Tax=Sphingomonas hylomeconis TaxID=1395958 RepID=UPI0021BA8281|nr:uroporphyrinogen-III synthase [Sphingomonas hylomeconis]